MAGRAWCERRRRLVVGRCARGFEAGLFEDDFYVEDGPVSSGMGLDVGKNLNGAVENSRCIVLWCGMAGWVQS